MIIGDLSNDASVQDKRKQNYLCLVQMAADAQDGDLLDLPPGDIEIYPSNGSSGIRFTASDLVIRGQGTRIKMFHPDAKVFVFSDAPGCTVSGISFVWSSLGYPAAFGSSVAIELRSSNEFTVERCTFERMRNAGLRAYQSTDIAVQQCRFRGTGKGQRGNALDVGIYVNDAAGGEVSVTDCKIQDHDIGALIDGADSVLIDRCSIRDIRGQHGIYLQDNGRAVVERCFIENCAMGGVKMQIQDSGANLGVHVARNNQISECEHGIVSLRASDEPGRFDCVRAQSNTVLECSAACIDIRRAVAAHISDNTVKGSGHGIRVIDCKSAWLNGNVSRAKHAFWHDADTNVKLSTGGNLLEDVP